MVMPNLNLASSSSTGPVNFGAIKSGPTIGGSNGLTGGEIIVLVLLALLGFVLLMPGKKTSKK